MHMSRVNKNLPAAKSNLPKSLPTLRASKMLETDGIGYPSPTVTLLRLR